MFSRIPPGAALNLTEETALAEDMLRRHGSDAAVKASDKACLKAAQGDEQDAAKWRRVMVAIAELSRQTCTPDRMWESY
jgi:hypothetical protein